MQLLQSSFTQIERNQFFSRYFEFQAVSLASNNISLQVLNLVFSSKKIIFSSTQERVQKKGKVWPFAISCRGEGGGEIFKIQPPYHSLLQCVQREWLLVQSTPSGQGIELGIEGTVFFYHQPYFFSFFFFNAEKKPQQHAG